MSDSYQNKKGTIIIGGIFLFISFLAPVRPAAAKSLAGNVKTGNQLYAAGDYQQALEEYRQALKANPESDIVNFNLGTALYKNKQYATAIQNLQKALLSDNAELRDKAHYNLANTLFYFGLSREDEDLDLAINSLEKALDHEQQVLQNNPDDEDAGFNRKIIERELERLRQKRQTQQQSKTCPRPKPEDQDTGQKPPDSESQDQNQDQQRKDRSGSNQSPSDQQPQQSPPESKPDQEPDTSAQAPNEQEQSADQSQREQPQSARPGQMTEQEAQQLIQRYQQTEEPQGILNLSPDQRSESPVLKDW